jgi:predicted glycoside hydrolase/deacetylase ChbG (UPF0249 family)
MRYTWKDGYTENQESSLEEVRIATGGDIVDMKVIFNADDFGLSKGVNLGIIEAYQRGPVRSTTIMAGMPGFEHAVMLAKENPGLKIGIHLTLSDGNSVGGVYRTLTDDDGHFFPLEQVDSKAKTGVTYLTEIEAEFEAQIQKVLSAGLMPDHFDSHQNTHNLPGVVTVFLELAKKDGVSARIFEKGLFPIENEDVKTTDSFSSDFYDETATPADLRRILSYSETGTLEIMCHPAFVDYGLFSSSTYNIKRAYELNVLTSPEVMDYMAQCRIEPCSFSDI